MCRSDLSASRCECSPLARWRGRNHHYLAIQATRSLEASAVRRLSGVLIGIVLGALVGDLMLRYVGSEAPVVPVVVNAIVLAGAALALKLSSVLPPAGSIEVGQIGTADDK